MSKRNWKKPIKAFLSASLVASLVLPAIPSNVVAATNATDLIISEYIEGSSDNKAIEIYNGTGSVVNLGDYKLEQYNNGKNTATYTVPLTGTLANGDVHVVYNSSAANGIKSVGDQVGGQVLTFNGDDAIVLKKMDDVVDSLGQVGIDPGTNWKANDVATSEMTLIRNSSVTSGDTVTNDSFDPSIEWSSLPQDDFSNLGSHIMDGSTPPEPTEPVEVTSATITGTAKVGETLTASANKGATNVTYQWQMSDTADGTYTNINGATNATLALATEQEGQFIKVIIKGENETSITSDATTAVAAADPEVPVEVMSIADARKQALNQEVTVKGIVTAKLKNTIQLQDQTAAIAVRPTALAIEIGDEVTLKGTLKEFNSLLQIDPASIVEKGNNVSVPAPVVITGDKLVEENESKLVTINNVTLTANAGSGNYTAIADGATVAVRDENGDLGLAESTTYESITGIVSQFKDTYQIIPRSQQDIIADSSVIQPVFANPDSGTYVESKTVTLTSNTSNAEILYTIDESDPVANGVKYEAPIEITKDTTIKAVVKTADAKFSEVKTFEYKITDSLQIHDIQGANHKSSFEGQNVENIQGVVTYSFKLGTANYYHIQTPDALADTDAKTSEAILLFSGKNAWPVNVGDLVSVTGKVSEYVYDGYAGNERQLTDMKTTQINVRDDQGGNVKVIQSGMDLPKPIIIDEKNLPTQSIDSDQLAQFNPDVDALDFWESIEGMRVEVGNVKAVAPQEHGDIVTVLESKQTNSLQGGILLEKDNQNVDRIQFRLEPNSSARDFEVATGDKFTGPINGVVGYSFQNYKIYVSLDEMKQKHSKGTAKPEQTKIVKEDDKLTIASYNLENFSNNTQSTTVDKAKKLARAIAKDMQGPDIVGVTEVQDNNGQTAGDSNADQSYQRLITEIENAGGPKYKYLNIDPVKNQDGGAPDANIRVGFLYNAERVSLPEGITAGNATTAVGYVNEKLTLNPGRIDPNNAAFNSSRKPLAAQFNFQGESVVVIANHWNSKNGDTPLFGSQQPPVYGSEAQREQIANVVSNFVKDIKTKNPDANVVSLGDFNDFQFSDALKIHEGDHMKNMINEVETSDRYTYVFQGNSQVLDHILVTNNLVKKTEIDILHINADFTDMAGRASDHDPVMVQIDLLADDVEEPIEAEKAYDIKNLTTKKLTIGKPSVSVILDDQSTITEGILFTGAYGEFQGEGFAKHSVTVKPANAGTIIDFKATTVKKVIIDGTNVKEIRGAESIQEIEYINDASANTIKFTNVKGEPIEVPSLPGGNKAPIVKKEIPNATIKVGESISILLTDHFSDLENDKLTFTSTKGTITESTLKLTLEKGSHIVGVTASDGEKSVTTNFSVNVTSIDSPLDVYYQDAFGKEGEALKTALHEIIDDHTQLSYDKAWEALRETDEDPKNKNNVILFYSGDSRSKSSNGGDVGQWNREHTWAKSHGNFGTSNGPGSDIHHLRPTDMQVNSSRGSLDFGNGGSSVKNCAECKRTSNSFEPPNRVKGDVARILFYMATRYEKGDKVDLELNEKLGNGSAPYHGKLSVLLEWHKQDPVDEFERNRNDVIQKWQGNRNPFIDHPEFAELIW
ncbi:endonuclease [Psychrobacillus sp. INOP01]|uniref:endonuclease n=1 Tax=Psychrobacillus sp. INOP01 TaxID=2829187 RepID=UPI001BA4E704|nr:endonuclease [Psychrobacillus sp. INOP01]QUG40563.1 endonuclease [Psychrobacillus sp. INOP01]